MDLQPLTRDQVRSIDRRAMEEFGLTGLVLMENAGRGCADVLCRLGCQGKVLIVCGRGNNGGDGFVMARHLELHGADVQVLLLADPTSLHGDAAVNYNVIQQAGLPVATMNDPYDNSQVLSQLAGAEWIVDAILGTGAVGAPREPLDQVIELLNESAARRMAIDIPSGLDCDTGVPSAATIRADHTCTFVAPKVGFSHPAAKPYLGQVHVIGIGAPARLLMDFRNEDVEF